MEAETQTFTAEQRNQAFNEFRNWYGENKDSNLKLQNLLKDPSHCDKFIYENEGFILDYSKQHVNQEAFEKLVEISDKFNIV